ncbi:MAG: SpoIVB peptidase [Clostridiaceae bacterium]|nr:SpoIVB peptidase [Clostridiaceae bacterium]MDY5889245.1 SpoIVB peptidase [Oscillospiraceae bacterium]
MKKCIRIVSVICFFVSGVIMMLLVVGYVRIPDEMTITEYDEINVGKTYVCQALVNYGAEDVSPVETEYSTSVKLFNIFPIKSAKVKVSRRKYVVPGGNAFGIRLYTKGVMIIRIDGVTTPSGNVSPGKAAGLKEGDMIISVDGVDVYRNRELSAIFASSGGKTLKLEIERDSKKKEINFTPVLCSEDSTYKGGLWIRDSTAGIGTVTWYDRTNGIFAGLGHAVCDADTGEIMPLSGGDAVEAEIKGCYKGTNGSAGELCGVFSSGSIGSLYINGETGVYGIMDSFDADDKVVPVALRQEVKTGAAQIICTVDDTGAEYYNIEIRKIFDGTDNQRNMVIKITDPVLLEKTGGIVQGMSGSPILQNGMLVGAVTHVFVDDPTEGYAIFAQNMTETAQGVEEYLKAS